MDVAGTDTIGIKYLKSGSKDARITVGDPTKTWSIASGWATAGDFSIIEEGVAGDRLYIKQGGNVGIGTTNPSRRLWVNGDAGGSTGWHNDSDERLKKNIKTIENPLDKVQKLRGVNFEWKDTENYPEGTQIGIVAQEAKEVVPEVVDKKGEYYSIAMTNLVPLLIEAIKEQQKEIENLKQEIETLKK